MSKIVINALQYKANSSGIGVMIRELFGRYAKLTDRRCQVILPQDAPDFPAGEKTELVRIASAHDQGLRRIFFQTFQMGRKYCKDAVLLTTDSKTPFFLPKSCELIPLVTDLAVYRMPEVYQRSRVLLWRLQYRYVRRRAKLFLAISEFTKQDMVELLHIPPEKIRVIPMACSEKMRRVDDAEALTETRKKYGLPEHFLLFVGNNNPRKNLERMICAFDMLKERTNLPHKLVIAGEQGWRFDRERALAGIKHNNDVMFIGFVPDEDMPALYSAAELFVFPTLYEGFGVPVLEAQSCGTPVLASNVSALPEVAGDSVIFANPYDVTEIYIQMRNVLTDDFMKDTLIERGFKNVQRYSWSSSAQKLDELIEMLKSGS